MSALESLYTGWQTSVSRTDHSHMERALILLDIQLHAIFYQSSTFLKKANKILWQHACNKGDCVCQENV